MAAITGPGFWSPDGPRHSRERVTTEVQRRYGRRTFRRSVRPGEGDAQRLSETRRPLFRFAYSIAIRYTAGRLDTSFAVAVTSDGSRRPDGGANGPRPNSAARRHRSGLDPITTPDARTGGVTVRTAPVERPDTTWSHRVRSMEGPEVGRLWPRRDGARTGRGAVEIEIGRRLKI